MMNAIAKIAGVKNTKVILYEIDIGGYYGGPNKKYYDMFNFMSRKQNAKVLTNEVAQWIKESLNKAGYNFTIIPA